MQIPKSPSLESPEKTAAQKSGRRLLWMLNGLILALMAVIGFFSYRYFIESEPAPPPVSIVQEKQKIQPQKPERVVQVDVLNGCGAKGIGIKFTNFLRTKGFDVVEMKNYKTFHVPQTLVVDRVGNLKTARQVAKALGINDKNVIQQINPDYYVDVSVIIGKDFTQLDISK